MNNCVKRDDGPSSPITFLRCLSCLFVCLNPCKCYRAACSEVVKLFKYAMKSPYINLQSLESSYDGSLAHRLIGGFPEKSLKMIKLRQNFEIFNITKSVRCKFFPRSIPYA